MTRLNKRRMVNYLNALLMGLMFLMMFMPFWNYGAESASINDYVWFPKNYGALEGYFRAELGRNASGINAVTAGPAIMCICAVIGIVLCIAIPKSSANVILPTICGLASIYSAIFIPEFRLGNLWWLYVIMGIIIAATAIFAVMIGKEKQETDKKGAKEKEKSERMAEIRELGNALGSIKNIEDADKNFNKLLNHIDDSDIECRKAAAEELAKTSREVAFTQISRRIDVETDAELIKVMHNTLRCIRENQKNG